MRNDRMLLSALLILWLVGGVSVHAQTKQTDKGAAKKMSSEDNFPLLIPETMPKSVGYSPVAAVTVGRSYSSRAKLPACSASVASSCVRSVILTDERFLHFQLRQDNCAAD